MSNQRPEDLAETEQWEQLKKRTRPQGVTGVGPYSWQTQAHTAALDSLADAIRELAAAIRTTWVEAYGQGRDDEAADLPLRYTEPRRKP